MVLTAYGALSPVIGLCCHRFSALMPKHQCRDASVEASGPHAFAVCALAVRPDDQLASTASLAQRFVTIAKRPS